MCCSSIPSSLLMPCYSKLEYLSLCPGQRRGYLIGKNLCLSVQTLTSMSATSAVDTPIQSGTAWPGSLQRGKEQCLKPPPLPLHAL